MRCFFDSIDTGTVAVLSLSLDSSDHRVRINYRTYYAPPSAAKLLIRRSPPRLRAGTVSAITRADVALSCRVPACAVRVVCRVMGACVYFKLLCIVWLAFAARPGPRINKKYERLSVDSKDCTQGWTLPLLPRRRGARARLRSGTAIRHRNLYCTLRVKNNRILVLRYLTEMCLCGRASA